MNLKIGNSYMIILKINNATLTYHCKIISEDEHFITFIDRYGKEFTYNKNLIIQIEKLNDGDKNGD